MRTALLVLSCITAATTGLSAHAADQTGAKTFASDALERVIEAGGDVSIIPGRALVKVRGIDDASLLHVSKADSDEGLALSEIGKRQGLRLTFVRATLFGWAVVDIADSVDGTLPDEDQTRDLIGRLAKDSAVDLVAEETWMKALRTPNDPSLNQMWHLEQIGAKAAWDRTIGLSSQRVGVIDTGLVRAHTEFSGRVAAGFDFVASASAGNDGDGRDADFNDAGDACNGSGNSFHGTHVAGTIGAATNNGSGIAGLNWNAGLVIGRALGRCGGSSVDIMEAAAWMAGARINGVPDVGANKVSVMNLSLGSANRCSAYEQQTIDFVTNAGTIMVVAAGNDGGAVGAPASCRGAVAVGAVGPTNSRTGYSSFGPEIAIMAPGGDQSRGNAAGVLSTLGTGYGFQQGTSMASPHVAGAISLMQALDPSLGRTAIVNLLRSSGAVCGNCQGVPAMRIGAALQSIGGTTTTPPPTTPPPTTTPPPASSGDDQWEENDTAATATRASCGINEARLIARAGDQDWFVFTPPAGQRISIDLDGGTPDLDLYVTDTSGQNILARSEGGTGVERISGNAGGSTLRILVNPYTDTQRGIAHAGPYRLTIRCGAAATAQSVGEQDVFVGGVIEDDVPVDAEATTPLDDVIPADDGVGTDDAIPVDADSGAAASDDAIAISASGGCTSSGHPAQAVWGLALLVILGRRRRLKA